MMGDPYTLVIALDDKQHASGSLYVDDGVSMAVSTTSFPFFLCWLTDGVNDFNSMDMSV